MDRYKNFEELTHFERLNIDYQIIVEDRGSPVTILAPHGGRIEPGTSEIVSFIAANCFNLYSFEGIKPVNNRNLHITSHRFDEPNALKLLAGSKTAVVIHACTGNIGMVYLGGLDTGLKTAVAAKLITGGIKTEEHPRFPGKNRKNLCNRCKTGQGLQLEISRDLRDDPAKHGLISSLVSSVLMKLFGSQ